MPAASAVPHEVVPRSPAAPSARRWTPLTLALSVLVFAGLSLAAGLTSEGFLEADACTHYLYARFALQEPHYFANVWGRPLCTGLYAIPAAVAGRAGVQVMSLLIALAIATVAMRIAKLQGYRWPVLALIFTLAQPLVFLHSFSELTELPFALVIACAFWAYQVRNFGLMALLIGLSPLGRPEGFGFIFLAVMALVAHRRWQWLPLLALPLIGWNHLGWELYGRPGPWWRWLPDNWPYAQESLYEPGHPLHFIAALPVIVSPLLFPATLLGMWQSLRLKQNRDGDGFSILLRDHRLRVQWLIALLPLSILFGHSVLYVLGKMASNGELRYLLIVAPFWGLLSAIGWEWIFQRFELCRPLLWAGVASILPVFVNVSWQVVPLTMSDDWREAEHVARWYGQRDEAGRYPYLCASHPAFYYFLDISPSGPKAREWHQQTIQSPPPGTILIWDPVYGKYNSDAARSITRDEIEAAGWVADEIVTNTDLQRGWRVYRSPEPAVQHPRAAE
jgi:hypothetical protein